MAEKKTPDWFTLGLIVAILFVFVIGQWLVFGALDGRIEALESRLDPPNGAIAARLDGIRDTMRTHGAIMKMGRAHATAAPEGTGEPATAETAE